MDTVLSKKLWMDTISSFNDPFEQQFEIISRLGEKLFPEDDPKNIIANIYEKMEAKDSHYVFTEEIIEVIKQWANRDKNFQEINNFVEPVKKRIGKFGIKCFIQSNPFNPLMWAHYAESHKGFCIEYEVDKANFQISNNGLGLYEVNYTTTRPRFDYLELLLNPNSFFERYLATKSHHWSYEEELRLVNYCLSEKDENKIDLPVEFETKSIILGHKFDTKKFSKKIESFHAAGWNVYSIVPDENEFKFHKKKCCSKQMMDKINKELYEVISIDTSQVKPYGCLTWDDEILQKFLKKLKEKLGSEFILDGRFEKQLREVIKSLCANPFSSDIARIVSISEKIAEGRIPTD